MDCSLHHVPLDNDAAFVAQYRFAEGMFFVLSETATEVLWPEFFGQTVDSIWLYALPSPNVSTSAPNPWKIALELNSSKMVTCELYNTQVTRGTVFLVRSYSEDKDVGRFGDWKKLTTNSICHAGRRMKSGVTFRDIILEAKAAGLIGYQLKDGRGHRYWITAVLSTIGKFIHEVERTITMDKESEEHMRRCWISLRHHTGAFGFEDEPDNRLNIVKGIWNRT